MTKKELVKRAKELGLAGAHRQDVGSLRRRIEKAEADSKRKAGS